jgi:plastocyanin
MKAASARRHLPLVCLFVSAFPGVGLAATLQATVSDGEGALAEAVVVATPVGGLSSREQDQGNAIIDQIDKQFVPLVTVIQAGTKVEFPNHDGIRHHVYSFSEAKTFEIPLYKGTPPEPIEFDKAGEVSLGCNIHDWMTAHILVTESPYFAKTDAQGRAELSGLPPGEYVVEVWHYEQAGPSSDTATAVSVTDGGAGPLAFEIEREKQWTAFRAPTPTSGSY